MYHPSEIKEQEGNLKKLDIATKKLATVKKTINSKSAVSHTSKAIDALKKDKIKIFKRIEKMKKANRIKKSGLFDGAELMWHIGRTAALNQIQILCSGTPGYYVATVSSRRISDGTAADLKYDLIWYFKASDDKALQHAICVRVDKGVERCKKFANAPQIMERRAEERKIKKEKEKREASEKAREGALFDKPKRNTKNKRTVKRKTKK